MTSKQESRLKMFLTLQIYLQSNPEIMATLPHSDEFMEALNAAIIQIQTNSEKRQISTKGVTNSKREIRLELIDCIADTSRKMQAFASYANNTVLLAETKTTMTALKQQSSISLSDTANGLYSLVDQHMGELMLYGLNVETQANFKQLINAFANAIPQPRQKQLNSKELSLLENQGFEAGDKACANIDTITEMVRLSQPNFYQGYRNARKIVEQGTGSLQVQGRVIDAVTQQPIIDATVSFSLTDQTDVVVEKQTAEKGGFNVKSLKEGVYNVSTSKVGYKDQTVSTVVSWDALCVIEITLEKL